VGWLLRTIFHDEFGRVRGIGVENEFIGGATLRPPAIRQCRSKKLKDTAIAYVPFGSARIALAVTERTASLNVHSLQTERIKEVDHRGHVSSLLSYPGRRDEWYF